MAFHNVVLPPGIAYGSAVGAGFNTISLQTASGHEVKVARQSQGRHRFQLLKALQTTDEAMTLKTFALARRGSLHSFLLDDVLDNTSNDDGQTAPDATDQALGTGDGTEDTFPLLKVYDPSGPASYTRTILHPVDGSVVVEVAGTPTTAFTMSGGDVVLDTPPTLGQIVTAGFSFRVPVRFSAAVDTWARLQADAYARWSAPDLEAVEVLDESEWPETWYPGGDTAHGSTATSIFLLARDGSLHTVTPTANISAFLPPPDLFPGGDQMFTIVNLSGTYTVQVRDDTGVAVGSPIAVSSVARVWLSVSSGTATWGIY